MSPTTRATPNLPPEIIDELLRMEELENSDLVKCCLVNKTWLQSARKSLYSTIDIRLVAYHAPFGESDAAHIVEVGYFLALNPSCSLLLSTLLFNRTLSQLVDRIRLEPSEEDDIPLDHLVVSMQPDDALETFARLCPHVKHLEMHDDSWFSGGSRHVIRSSLRALKHIQFTAMTSQVLEDLLRFDRLSKISSIETTLSPSTTIPTILSGGIVDIDLGRCDRASFEQIQTPTWSTLRTLRIPVNLVPVVKLSQFPQLERLALHRGYEDGPLSYGDFCQDLAASKSLKVFEFNVSAQRALRQAWYLLGKSMPPTCSRVEMGICNSFDAILLMTQQAQKGHRIRQLGLSHAVSLERVEVDRHFLSAVRALLDSIRVELIWCA